MYVGYTDPEQAIVIRMVTDDPVTHCLLCYTPRVLSSILTCCDYVQSMFSYAVKHPVKKADIEARNYQKLSPLALASKLGRFRLFNEIIQLQSRVRSEHCVQISTVNFISQF